VDGTSALWHISGRKIRSCVYATIRFIIQRLEK